MIEYIPANIPEYLICDNYAELPEGEFILCTKPPFWIAQVFKFENRVDLDSFLDNNNCRNHSRQMVYYNIIAVCVGTLDNNTIKGGTIPKQILSEMLNVYFVDRVSNHKEIEELYFNKTLHE